MKKVTTLLFDIGNVFIYADHEITHEHLIEKYNIPKDKVELFYKIPDYINFSEGKISGEEFSQSVKKVMDKPDLTIEQVRFAHDIHLVRPIKEAIDTLNSIYDRKKYKIAVITNTNAWQNEKIDEMIDFSKYSNIFIKSNEVGMTKRNLEIFRMALKQIGNNNVLFIDDSDENIKTAKSLGIESLKVTKNEPHLRENLIKIGLQV